MWAYSQVRQDPQLGEGLQLRRCAGFGLFVNGGSTMAAHRLGQGSIAPPWSGPPRGPPGTNPWSRSLIASGGFHWGDVTPTHHPSRPRHLTLCCGYMLVYTHTAHTGCPCRVSSAGQLILPKNSQRPIAKICSKTYDYSNCIVLKLCLESFIRLLTLLIQSCF